MIFSYCLMTNKPQLYPFLYQLRVKLVFYELWQYNRYFDKVCISRRFICRNLTHPRSQKSKRPNKDLNLLLLKDSKMQTKFNKDKKTIIMNPRIIRFQRIGITNVIRKISDLKISWIRFSRNLKIKRQTLIIKTFLLEQFTKVLKLSIFKI